MFVLFSHKSATGLVNDIKRNLTTIEDILGQCSVESRTKYDGDVTELKVQLERLMVKSSFRNCFFFFNFFY